LINNNFKLIKAEQYILKYKVHTKTKYIIELYFDDMVSGETKYIKDIILKINKRLKISNWWLIEYFLGIKVEKRNKRHRIFQKGF